MPTLESPNGQTGGVLCPSCDSPSHNHLFESWNAYPILRCDACSLVFTDDSHAPPPHTLYPAFSQSDTGVHRKIRTALSVFLRQREELVKSIKPSGRLLDYGCGSGAFARWMSEHGFEVVGLEPFSLGSPSVSEGLLLLREPLEKAKSELGQFDVITMWHVLEHIKHPSDLLRELLPHLKKDGRLIVSVPNFGSLQSKSFKGAWFHLDPPRHLIHFEQQTLRDCLYAAGFEVVDEKAFLPEYGTSGWVQSTLNSILPHKNFLFEFIKDRGALRGMAKGTMAAHIAASLALGGPLLAASLPLEALAAARAGGAALTLAARPR